MKHFRLVPVLLLAALACQSSPHGTKAAWSYEGPTGPEHWGDLSPDYVLAKTGRRQSPVDIVTSKAALQSAAPLEASYQDTSLEILNNGHTIEDDYHDGGTLTLDRRPFHLAQFHFHAPSEHTVDGQHAPMEVHLVHEDASGELAVIGILVREGREHPELAKLLPHLPKTAGRTEAVEGTAVNASRLFPASHASYRYTGSLTTPPCTEDVSWFVLQESIEASAEQIAAFRALIQGNNRPTQPLNGRTIALVR